MKRILRVLLLFVFFFPVMTFALEQKDYIIDFSKIHYDVETSTEELVALQILLDQEVLLNTSFHGSDDSRVMVYRDEEKEYLFVNPSTGEFSCEEGEVAFVLDHKNDLPEFLKDYDRIIVRFGYFQGEDPSTFTYDLSSYQKKMESPDSAEILLNYLVDKKELIKEEKNGMIYLYDKNLKLLVSYSENGLDYTVSVNALDEDNISFTLEEDFSKYFSEHYGHELPKNYTKAEVIFRSSQYKKVQKTVTNSIHRGVSETKRVVVSSGIFFLTCGVCGVLYFVNRLVLQKKRKKHS